MALRAGNTIVTQHGGTITRGKSGKAKTYSGPGKAPSGTKKVKPKTIEEIPITTVTTAPSGEKTITTSGFKSPTKAKQAVRRRQRSAKRVQRILADTTKPSSAVDAVGKAADTLSDLASAAPRALAAAPKLALVERDKAAVKVAKIPNQKVTKAFGKPTLGTPKVKEVVQAKKQGRLSGVRKGRVVATPQARKATKQLMRAKKAYAKKAKPNIEGLLNEEQERFAEAFSKASGLPPKLAGDWTLKESGASSAGAGGEAGEQNQLGIGYPAKPTAMSQSNYFNNVTPEQAGKNSAKWIRGEIGGEYSYKAAPSIQAIDDLVKSGASEDEIRSYIAGPSAWGTGEIPNSPQVTARPGKAGPKVTAKLKTAEKQAKKLGIKTTASKEASPTTRTLPARKLKGSWGGSYSVLKNAVKGFPVSSEKRAADHSLSISNPGSDHNEANSTAFAYDIPTTDGEGWAHKIAKRLGIKGYQTGDYTGWTSPKYPGYEIQVLWAVDGHFDHVHVGAHWTGEDLKPGTYAGGPSGTPSSSGGAYTVAGSTVSSYAAATGQSVAQVKKQAKQGKLTPQEIYEKLEALGVEGANPLQPVTEAEAPDTDSVLSELESRYGKSTV